MLLESGSLGFVSISKLSDLESVFVSATVISMQEHGAGPYKNKKVGRPTVPFCAKMPKAGPGGE